MSRLEGQASVVIREIAEKRSRVLTEDQRETLAFFIALQWSRHRLLLDLIRSATLEGNPVEDGAPDFEYATKSLGLHNIIFSVLAPWEARRSGDWTSNDEVFSSIADRVLSMEWGVFHSKQDALIVSDNIVCLSGVAAGCSHEAPSDAWTDLGVGIGFANCRRITVPLTPRLAIVVAPNRDDARGLRAQQINRYTVGNSREFVAFGLDWPNKQPKRYAEVQKHLFVQRVLMAEPHKLLRSP